MSGWLDELLDRDYPKARASYELAAQRDEGPRDPMRMLAFSRLCEIEAFVAKPERVTELRQRMREIGGDPRNFPGLPISTASIRRSLETLSKVLHEGATATAPSERSAELRKRIVTEVTESGALARPFLTRQLGMLRPGGRATNQAQLEALRQSLEDAKRRGDVASSKQLQAQIDAHQAEMSRFQPRRESLRAYALEIVRQRLEGRDERASRLEEALKQADFVGAPMRRMLRNPIEGDARLFSQRTLAALESLLKSERDLSQDERTTLEACRDRAKELYREGRFSKSRDLLWPVLLLIGRG